jgi:hypothetical protein
MQSAGSFPPLTGSSGSPSFIDREVRDLTLAASLVAREGAKLVREAGMVGATKASPATAKEATSTAHLVRVMLVLVV